MNAISFHSQTESVSGVESSCCVFFSPPLFGFTVFPSRKVSELLLCQQRNWTKSWLWIYYQVQSCFHCWGKIWSCRDFREEVYRSACSNSFDLASQRKENIMWPLHHWAYRQIWPSAFTQSNRSWCYYIHCPIMNKNCVYFSMLTNPLMNSNNLFEA